MIELTHGGGWVGALAAAAAAWQLTWLGHGTVLLAAAWVLSRRGGPGVRERLWKAAIVASLLTATLSTARSEATSLPPLPARGERLAAAPAEKSRLPAQPLVLAWMILAAAGAVRLERGRRRFWREVGPRETLVDGDVVAQLRSLRQRCGTSRTVYLTTADGIQGPVAIGTSEICLPASSLARLDLRQRESVLAHELGHVLRRDPAWRLATELLVALLPLQPLLRVARRELRECAEMACDDFAVRTTHLRRPLVESLTLLAEGPQLDNAAVMAFGEAGSALTRRVRRILDHRPAPPRQGAAAAALGALLLMAGVAAAVPVARPAGPDGWHRLRVISTEFGAEGGAPGFRREAVLRSTATGVVVQEYRENGARVQPDAAARAWLDLLVRQHRPD